MFSFCLLILFAVICFVDAIVVAVLVGTVYLFACLLFDFY